MLVIFSHLLAFSTLFVASVWDLKTTEVPDHLGIVGIAGGLALHAGHAYLTGSLEPLLWSLGVGSVFSLYGWGMYFFGMWGGADAFSLSVLGFAAPFGLEGMGLLHSANLFVNVMLLGFVYTLLNAFYLSYGNGIASETLDRLGREKLRVALEIGLAAVFSLMASSAGLNGLFFFSGMVGMIVLYRFLKQVEDDLMIEDLDADEIEEGDVPAPGQGFGRRVKGLTREEIDSIDRESLKVKRGVRFVPVFPLALAATDVFGLGFSLLAALV